MGIYLLVIGEISILSLIQNRLRNTYLFVITLSLILLVGMRPLLLGTDTGSYVDLFNGIVNGRYWDSSLSNLFSGRFEIGFLDYVKLVAGFTDNPRFLLLSSAIIMYVPLAFYIKRESLNPMLSFLLFFTMTYFPQSMSAMRQSMAVGFLMLAVLSLPLVGTIFMDFHCLSFSSISHFILAGDVVKTLSFYDKKGCDGGNWFYYCGDFFYHYFYGPFEIYTIILLLF